MTKTTRVSMYQELRDNIKGEIKIDRSPKSDVVIEDDDFLSFLSSDKDNLSKESTSNLLEKEVENNYSSIAREASFDTRLNILNQIRGTNSEPQISEVVEKKSKTSLFKTFKDMTNQSNGVETEAVIDIKQHNKEEKIESTHMTLMKRLSEMSPKKDAIKAKEFLEDNDTNVEKVNLNKSNRSVLSFFKDSNSVEKLLKIWVISLFVVFLILSSIIVMQLI